MAIAAAAITYRGNGPTESGQIVVGNESGARGQVLMGHVTFIGDGSATTAQCNFIDGTKTLSFTPSAVIMSRTGGDATATITATEFEITDAAKGTVTFSAAPGNTNTVKLGIIILP